MFSFLRSRFGCFSPSPEPEPSPVPTPFPVAPTKELQELFELHNAERSKKLEWHPVVYQAAQLHAEWMAKNNRMSHTGAGGSSFSSRLRDIGFVGSPTGENIAWGATTAKSVFNMWMNSMGHRRNILNSSSDLIGLGVAPSASGAKYWCAVFGADTGDDDLQVIGLEALPPGLSAR